MLHELSYLNGAVYHVVSIIHRFYFMVKLRTT